MAFGHPIKHFQLDKFGEEYEYVRDVFLNIRQTMLLRKVCRIEVNAREEFMIKVYKSE